MKILTSLLILAGLTFGQSINPEVDAYFNINKTTTLAAAAEVLTVQHTATSTKNVLFKNAYIYCSVACTVTLEHSGTAATSAALTINANNPNDSHLATTNSSAFSSSNVGTGTVINVYQISAGGYISLDLTNFILPGGIADNLTLRTNSITGTFQGQITWVER